MSIVKLNNQAVKNATSFGSITGLGSMVFIKKLTASSSGTLSFVDGSSDVVLDNTYKEYLFTFNNIHPSQDGSTFFSFNMSVDSGSNYNVAKTTTDFYAYHNESGSDSGLYYDTNYDLANGTGFQYLADNSGGDNDQGASGYLHLYNPSSTTFVKHFISRVNISGGAGISNDNFSAGYGNTTSAVDAVIFQMSSGNIDSGTIKLYGIKDS